MELRDLPSVGDIADDLAREYPILPRPVVVHVCREALTDARDSLRLGEAADPSQLARRRLDEIDAARPRVVVNATGVLLHTNLGRAPMPAESADVLAAVGGHFANVEVDVRTGRRSRRNDYLGHLLPLATGAGAGIAVNNNAGALLLALASLAGRGGRVAVSRGELIEIGGSFRLPDLMEASGAELVEVGTTNRTRVADFERVAGDVDVFLKVHPSNYRIEGFQHQVAVADLAVLASEHSIPFVFDAGSGLLDASAPWLGDGNRSWLNGEPGVVQALAEGADLVLFSGDKLLGGPQAGLIVGDAGLVEAASRHPMARALRLDGGTIAALSATLRLYLDQQVLSIPFWRMASMGLDEIEQRSRSVVADLPGVSIEDGASVPGAGSVPGATIPTKVIRIDKDADAVWARLASGEVPVISTRREGAVYLDLRSVRPDDDAIVAAALARALA